MPNSPITRVRAALMRTAIVALLALLTCACDYADTPLAPSRVVCDSTAGTLANDDRGEPENPAAPVVPATPAAPPEPVQPAGVCED